MAGTEDLRAVPTVQLENDRVRVTEWRFAPGAATGWHRHEYDYVVVPILDGTLVITNAEGESRSELRLGHSYYRDAGVEHDVRNGNAYEFAFIEVEMK